MGAARIGFDLRCKVGWRNLRYVLSHKAHRLSTKDVLMDTFLPMWCGVVGHIEYDSSQGGYPPEPACKRCRHFIGESK